MLYDNNYIVIDLETGGLSAQKNPITEVACVILNHQMEVIKEYQTLVKPYGNLVLERQALEVTGLTVEEINKGKDSKQVVSEMIDLFKPLKKGKFMKPIMIGHNIIKFDSKFLIEFFNFHNKDLFDVVDDHVEDTMWIARNKWGSDNESANFKLATCCARAEIELVQGHRALADTRSTAQLFSYFTKCLRSENTIVQEKKSVRETFTFNF
jgi:DNA polymerase III alpha subunit (gram-positive type)